ncbi:transaldolase [Deinococcus radiopugnans]|uniref:Transaldolase n=2 Tax=Deinococcus radiopugnans TaxID=57497 RepID=A0A0A7KDB4_9DEIO|nr:transaldolase [Deinococcus radiopugnans]AIZ44126.1 transaldolase [Deinococcus radiopugnans]MBB6015483.1 transaldolase [Deinococcus radiopugnans ATCC 19172]QLG09659.1 transaldolase [Deinococcus sp. D7000]TNM72798.1 transaldolase [Deinococcus radiopugnans ATCC 19172]
MNPTQTATKTDKLEQLKAVTVVVADTGDIEAIKKYQPQDCTTNPSLILKASQLEGYSDLMTEARDRLKAGESVDDVIDRLTVRVGTELTKIVPGNVSTEVDARLSFDKDALLARARHLIALYEENGVGKDRILIKLASTWEGVEAARILQKEGIRCNMTLLFNLEQAVASAQAGAYLISPFVGRITDWYKKSTGTKDYPVDEDPGIQSVREIYHHFKSHGYETIIMGASFRSAAQVEALAGCDRLTISPQLLGELAEDHGPLEVKLNEPMGHEKEELITEAQFRYSLASNAMAGEKLYEGIRGFAADTEKLGKLLAEVGHS